MRSLQLQDDDAAVVFRGELGIIDLDAPATTDTGPILNAILAQALVKRCSEDPNFVDEQIQWLLWGAAEPEDQITDP